MRLELVPPPLPPQVSVGTVQVLELSRLLHTFCPLEVLAAAAPSGEGQHGPQPGLVPRLLFTRPRLWGLPPVIGGPLQCLIIFSALNKQNVLDRNMKFFIKGARLRKTCVITCFITKL